MESFVANGQSSTVSVLLGAGDGTFAANVDYQIGYVTSSVALGDLDGDGRLDIVATTWASSSTTVSVLLGTGGGKFAANVDYTTGGIVNDAKHAAWKWRRDLRGKCRLRSRTRELRPI
jgi:hypothetical protein